MVEKLNEVVESFDNINGVDAIKGLAGREVFVEVEEEAVGKFFGKQRRMENVERGLTSRDPISHKYALTAWLEVEE